MVLVCGDPYEPVTAFLCSRLKMLKIDHRLLDLREFPQGIDLDWTWVGGRPCGSISTSDWRIEFDELSGAYFRNVELNESGDEGEKRQSNAPAYAETDARLAAMLNSLSCNVLNRPTATWWTRKATANCCGAISSIALGIVRLPRRKPSLPWKNCWTA